MKMADDFNWIRSGYEVVKSNFKWNVQVPFLLSTNGNGKQINSPLFSPEETPNTQWILSLCDRTTKIEIDAWLYDSTKKNLEIVDPVQMKISIINKKKKKVLQKILCSKPNSQSLIFDFNKEMFNTCQQENGSYTFICKILSHLKKELVSSDPPGIAINCLNGLSAQFQGLFDSMQLSDVIFNIEDYKFTAHKSIFLSPREC